MLKSDGLAPMYANAMLYAGNRFAKFSYCLFCTNLEYTIRNMKNSINVTTIKTNPIYEEKIVRISSEVNCPEKMK